MTRMSDIVVMGLVRPSVYAGGIVNVKVIGQRNTGRFEERSGSGQVEKASSSEVSAKKMSKVERKKQMSRK